uniref:Uncharacterized protein n=1 Tax=Plectus sambesii TaxID=2011161 RepID=A0A914VHK9_9BILA
MTFVLTSEPNGSAISKRTEYAIRNLKKHECRYRLINLGTEEGAEWDKKVKEWERSVLGEKWFEDWNDLNKQEIKWKEISQNCQQCEWSKTEDGGIKPTRTCETCKISGVPLKKKRHEMELEKRNLTIERRPLFANAEKTLIGSILDFEIALENEQSGLAAFLGCATQEAILGRMKLLQDAINVINNIDELIL